MKSEKFDNTIFYSICEFTINNFPSHFTSYRLACESIKNSIERDILENKDMFYFSTIIDNIDKIFGLSKEESAAYVLDYFLLNKCSEFEDSVKKIKENFITD